MKKILTFRASSMNWLYVYNAARKALECRLHYICGLFVRYLGMRKAGGLRRLGDFLSTYKEAVSTLPLLEKKECQVPSIGDSITEIACRICFGVFKRSRYCSVI
jgi:hypothetical protein